jgi:hypothetical protein
MERGTVEIGAEILLRIAREFGRTWNGYLLGKTRRRNLSILRNT